LEVLIDTDDLERLRLLSLPLDLKAVQLFSIKVINNQIPAAFIEQWKSNKIWPADMYSAILIMRYQTYHDQEVVIRYYALQEFQF
jgi:hypothetical protein